MKERPTIGRFFAWLQSSGRTRRLIAGTVCDSLLKVRGEDADGVS